MQHDIKRMLELAAKAAGYDDAEYQEGEWMQVRYGFASAVYSTKHDGYLAPHEDDIDSRFLQVKLGLLVDVDWNARTVTAVLPDRVEMIHTIVHSVSMPEGSDGMAETRLAVLMAAAAIGEAMP